MYGIWGCLWLLEPMFNALHIITAALIPNMHSMHTLPSSTYCLNSIKATEHSLAPHTHI